MNAAAKLLGDMARIKQRVKKIVINMKLCMLFLRTRPHDLMVLQ